MENNKQVSDWSCFPLTIFEIMIRPWTAAFWLASLSQLFSPCSDNIKHFYMIDSSLKLWQWKRMNQIKHTVWQILYVYYIPLMTTMHPYIFHYIYIYIFTKNCPSCILCILIKSSYPYIFQVTCLRFKFRLSGCKTKMQALVNLAMASNG